VSMRSAVLFLVFNRADTTARVFDAIRQARPPRLYVAADGPRASRPGEADRCEAVRRLATAIDWPCELMTLCRTENLGCKRAVSSGISWFFDHEPEGIILEDDCVPDPSFFPYCDELLERYRDDARVMSICGDNFVSCAWAAPASYYFSSYVPVWGWASWRRAWASYDVEMTAYKQDGQRILADIFADRPRARTHWKGLLDKVAAGQVDTWDYQWLLACWMRGGLCCTPSVNLITNIGFGKDATHTLSPESRLANMPAQRLPPALTHPEDVTAAGEADDWLNKHVLGIDEDAGVAKRVYRAMRDRFHRLRAAGAA
jgi:hypothetical protein